jgi:hypothetical protein
MSDQLRPNGQIEALAVQTQILPTAASIGALALHMAVGEELLPWMSMISSLNPSVIHLVKEAMRIDARANKQLMYSSESHDLSAIMLTAWLSLAKLGLGSGSLLTWAASSSSLSMPPASLDFSTAINHSSGARFDFKRWDLMSPLKTAMTSWATSKCTDIGLWTQRQLEMETAWRKTSDFLGYGQFAVEVAKVNNDAADAIFEMGLPVSRDALIVLLSGVDSSLHRCASYILDRLGTITRLVPPLPNPTRYKKEVVVKQELTEQATLEGKPPPSDGVFSRLFSFKSGPSSSFSKASSSYKPEEDDPIATSFLESVPKIEASPEYVNISKGLENNSILLAIHSLSFLKEKASALAKSVAVRWTSLLPLDQLTEEEAVNESKASTANLYDKG